MRIALCQTNPTVGDLAANRSTIAKLSARASEAQADLAVFPELAIAGYPPRDLLDRPQFANDCVASLHTLANELPARLTVVVGAMLHAETETGLYNAAVALRDGRIVAVCHKRLLPSYDVFDERRYFTPGTESTTIMVAGERVGLTVCEDIWNDTGDTRHSDSPLHHYGHNPIADLVERGADLIVNIAASPFTLTKRAARHTMLANVARDRVRPVVFVNQVGGNDDLIFDGDSTVFDAQGNVHARLRSFEEDFEVADLASPGRITPPPRRRAETALRALELGVRDYARKCGFEGAVIGLSGGIDSALTAAIAARALGPEQVLGVALPSRYSSPGSLTDAQALASALGITYRVIPIDSVFQSYLDLLPDHLAPLPKHAATNPAAQPHALHDVTFENVQARIRCATLMAISNRLGLLLLTTGNKSEIAVGYCTLYGDMAGGLAAISDVPKTFVYEIAREVNRQAGTEWIPESTLTKAPSAELRPDQKDEDSLPPYEDLDAVLEQYVEDGRTAEEIIVKGHDETMVRRVIAMVCKNEYKRRQMPPGLIITRKAFGPGRRMPIAQRWCV